MASERLPAPKRNWLRRIGLRLVTYPVVLVVALWVFTMLFEDRYIYYPTKFPEGDWDPEGWGLSVEDCFLVTADGVRIHGWVYRASPTLSGQAEEGSEEGSSAKRPLLLWCHGNAGNISDRLTELDLLTALEMPIFLIGYRGYGKSEGSPSESGLYEDAVAAYDWAAAQPWVDPTRIFGYGQSLGGAVIVELAVRRKLAGLALESTFTSVPDMARSAFPFLPLHYWVRSRYESLRKIAGVGCPVLIAHGTRDTIVPFDMGRRLFDASADRKEFYPIEGADHNDMPIIGGSSYLQKMKTFLESCPSRQ